MEKLAHRVAETTIILGSLYLISKLAFSFGVRKEIGKRDGWACQYPGCDKSFADGWMVHASHNPDIHHKTHPLYNHPSSGDIRCIEHHKEQHMNGTTLGYDKDMRALSLLEQVDERTHEWRKFNE